MFRPRVLAVDDRSENLQVYREILAPLDIEYITAMSGQEALWLALKYEFSLILLDVQMPDMDGIETAEYMRRRERTRDVPIIFVTAGDFNKKLRFEGYEVGAIDFLFKPFDPHLLRSKVKVLTDLDRKTRQLRLAKDEAEAASLAKSRFLATVSHELRTPLNAILGYIQLMRQSDRPLRDHQDHLDIISSNGTLLGRLIDDILDLTRAESGELAVEKTRVNLPRILDDVHALFTQKAREKGLDLTVERQGALPHSFSSDPTRLRQILINLLGNAVKFTPPGGKVALVAEQVEDRLRFQVSDTGIGIAPEQHANIFLPFFQASASHRRHFGGAGLGLDLAKRLSEALGGQLTLVHSELGKGSTFALFIPLEEAEIFERIEPVSSDGATVTPLEDSALAGLRILVAEDSEANQLLMREILSNEGAACNMVCNGAEAVKCALQHKYDVVILDMCMPVMDGYEAAREMRVKGYAGPILALTANALPEYLEQARQAGCNASLTKPLDIALLVKTIAEMSRSSGALVSPVQKPRGAATTKHLSAG